MTDAWGYPEECDMCERRYSAMRHKQCDLCMELDCECSPVRCGNTVACRASKPAALDDDDEAIIAALAISAAMDMNKF